MIFRILLLGFWLLMTISFTTCNFKETPVNPTQRTESKIPKYSKENTFPPHSYGGWYCPDNILGFPAQIVVWHNWLNKVKELSEQKMNLENYFGVRRSAMGIDRILDKSLDHKIDL